MERKHNFSGGPGALPDRVLEEASEAVRGYGRTGVSILGLSHRSREFNAIIEEAEGHLRVLLGLPKGCHVLFLQGGGSLQFAMVPMHLTRPGGPPPDYIVSGYWSAKALAEAEALGSVRVAWSGASTGYSRLPLPNEIDCARAPAFLHYVTNETVEGLQFQEVPGFDTTARVADMSSDFLSMPHTIDRFQIVYAHAQKNLGPAGVTVALVQDAVVREAPRNIPSILSYRVYAEHRSIYNTPPVYSIYVTLLVLRWLRFEIGGLANMEIINKQKAALLYAELDAHPEFYEPHAERRSRSLMNVTFRLRQRTLESTLVERAEAGGFHGIGGHRSLGGLRVSLYNAVPLHAVQQFVAFLQEFRDGH